MPVSSNSESLRVQHSHRIPNEEQQQRLRRIRQVFLDLAVEMDAILPKSREASLCQTKIDEARMWACNAATLTGEIKDLLPINHPAD